MDILNRNKYLLPMVVGSLVIFGLVLFLIIRGDENEIPDPVPAEPSKGFTFFELGADSRISDTIRKHLEDRLGPEAMERRTVIDLSINYAGFLKDHFPELHRINRELNDPSGARVEHNTIRLTYRYSQQHDTPFYFVELVFSINSRLPLYFKIKSKKEGVDIIHTFRSKYGDPQQIDWSGDEGSSLFWKENNDTLIVSKLKDRFGSPEYHIAIYFFQNIRQMVTMEEEQIEKQATAKKEAGKTAF